MSGSLTHPPNFVLRTLLVSLGGGTLPSASGAWPIGVGQATDTPDNAIVIYNTAGRTEGRRQNDGQTHEKYGVQVMVRSGDEKTGYAKANALAVLMDAINYSGVSIDSSGYLVYGVNRVGTIISLGKNEPISNRNIFTINATISLRQST